MNRRGFFTSITAGMVALAATTRLASSKMPELEVADVPRFKARERYSGPWNDWRDVRGHLGGEPKAATLTIMGTDANGRVITETVHILLDGEEDFVQTSKITRILGIVAHG